MFKRIKLFLHKRLKTKENANHYLRLKKPTKELTVAEINIRYEVSKMENNRRQP